MNALLWIVFGGIAGVVANALDPHPSAGGILGAVVLGIVGAVVGGFLGSTLLGVGITGFNLISLAVAVGGSLITLFAVRLISRTASA